MINKLIDGITLKLFNKFGERYEIYTETVEQGLIEPCFFINVLKPTKKLFRNNRYYTTHSFCIQYITNSNDKKNECNNMSEILFDLLEYITIEEITGETLIRGSNMSSEYLDGVLSFYINYDFYENKSVDEKEKINSFEYNSKVERY